MLALPILPAPVPAANGPQAIVGAADATGASAGDVFASLLAGQFAGVVTPPPDAPRAALGPTNTASDEGQADPPLAGLPLVGPPLASPPPAELAPPTGAAPGPGVQSGLPAAGLPSAPTLPAGGPPAAEAPAQVLGGLPPDRAAMAAVAAGFEAAPQGQAQGHAPAAAAAAAPTAVPAVATPAQVDPTSMALANTGAAAIDDRPLGRAKPEPTPPERAPAAAITAAGIRPAADPALAPELRAARALVEGPELAADPTAEGADGLPTRAERPATEPLVPARASSSPAVQIALQIAKAVPGRVARMIVQLEPKALGRVEVRLEFGHDNRLTAMIAVERPETLEALQRDTRALERSLEAAGLRLDDRGLSFSLEDQGPRDEHMARQDQPFGDRAGRFADRGAGAVEPETDANRWVGGLGLLDIRV